MPYNSLLRLIICRAVELKGDVLYVYLDSSVLREELSLGKSKIIVMINEELGKDLVSKLVLC